MLSQSSPDRVTWAARSSERWTKLLANKASASDSGLLLPHLFLHDFFRIKSGVLTQHYAGHGGRGGHGMEMDFTQADAEDIFHSQQAGA